jgi:hypothetical protein
LKAKISFKTLKNENTTPVELAAYDKGRQHEQATIIKFIKN